MKNIRSIEWHRECQKNQKQYGTKMLAEARAMEADAMRILNEAFEYGRLIKMAEAAGKTEFDRERYGKKKLLKSRVAG